jgi:hypothetical protein
VHASPAQSLAADPAADGQFYAVTAAGLVKFLEWGASEPLVLNAAVKYTVAVNPVNPSNLFADNLRSTDGGANWVTALSPLLFPTTGTATYPHIAISGDGGFLLATAGDRDSYRSDNGGLTWTSVNDMIDTVAIDPTNRSYYYLGSCTSNSSSCGPTGCVAPLGISPHIHDIVVNARQPYRVFAYSTFYSNIMFSPDHGVHWLGHAPLSGTVREGAVRFDAVNGTIYLPTSVGLLVKDDSCADLDLDGFSPETGCGPVDCQDGDAAIGPARTEICQDGLDNDCNGLVDFDDLFCSTNCTDADGDGFRPETPAYCGGDDCNDADPGVHPGAVETLPPDTIDQDCNGYDLTIVVSKAAYTKRSDSLTVQATSALGASAGLQAVGYGPLVWNAKRSSWAATFAAVGGNPGQVTVQGIEGAVNVMVTAK